MDALLDEVESLEAILMDDVRITKNAENGVPEIIETTVFPQLDEECEQQFVCVTLQVLPKPGYPESASPDFKLLRPRGLDDARLEAIRAACVAKLKEALGYPVVFDLIEVVRELLTNTGNLPCEQCVICLYGFTDGDEFTRTTCFHYLHSYCLARHLNALRRNYNDEFNKLPAWLQKTAEPFRAACPVCREAIADETDSLKCAMPPAELQNAPEFKLTQELRALQQRMTALFLEQKSRGGIIDIEAESGTVLSIETEEELRRRLQRKQAAEAAAAAAAAIQPAPLMHRVGSTNNHGGGVTSVAVAANGSSNNHCSSSVSNNIDAAKCTPTTATVNDKIEKTEKAEKIEKAENRRHYRGGRRHQHHFHHHNREREQERFERNHVPQHSAAANNGSVAVAAGTSKEPMQQANSGGKHSKANSHAR